MRTLHRAALAHGMMMAEVMSPKEKSEMLIRRGMPCLIAAKLQRRDLMRSRSNGCVIECGGSAHPRGKAQSAMLMLAACFQALPELQRRALTH